MRRPTTAVLAAALAAAALAPAGTAIAAARHSSSARHATGPQRCQRERNPYSESIAVLRACGDIIMPLQRVTPLPGGGKAYHYASLVQDVPPEGFDVLRATDRQLREYGLPTRRQLGARWYQVVRHMRSPVTPRPYLVQVPELATLGSGCPSGSCNWSGYAVTGHAYNQVSAQWFEPHFGSDNCSATYPTEWAQWVGIGGFNSGPPNLGQDGTVFNVNGLAPHQAVIETIDSLYPKSPPVPIDLQASPGQVFYAQTTWIAASQWYDYYMANDTTDTSDPFYGKYWSGHSRSVASKDLSSAEVITEMPSYPGLSNYGHYQIQDADTTWNWGADASLFGNLPPADINKVVMTDPAGHTLSSPGTLTNGLFNTFWSACS